MQYLRAAIILLTSFLQPGVHPALPPAPPHRVVTEIRVEYTHGGTVSGYTYRKPEDLETILTYLRLIERRDPVAIDPDTFRADVWDFRLSLSDGTYAAYRQLHREYLQYRGGPWRRVICADDLQFPPP